MNELRDRNHFHDHIPKLAIIFKSATTRTGGRDAGVEGKICFVEEKMRPRAPGTQARDGRISELLKQSPVMC